MEATQTMNAFRARHQGGPDTLIYEPVARPVPNSGEVLVEVHAAAITPTELTWDPTWSDDRGKSRLPVIPSHEFSGVVAKLGTDVTSIVTGDEVYGLIDLPVGVPRRWVPCGKRASVVLIITSHA